MFKSIIILTAFVTLFACKEQKNTINMPIDIIQEYEMVQIIKDLNLVEAMYTANYPNLPASELNNISVFKEHNVSVQQFKDSYAYYANQPGKIKEFQELVTQELYSLSVATNK